MQNKEIVVRPERLKTMEIKGELFRSAYDFNLQKQDLEQALSELGETEDLMNASLEKLKTMLSRDQNMRYRTDDKYLLRYLRYTKYDCKKSYTTIRGLYKLRASRPDIFAVPSDIEAMLNLRVMNCLPYRDEAGSLVMWIDSKKWNLKDVTLFDLLQLANAVSDLISMNPSCQVNSIVGFNDMAGVTAGHLAQYLYPRFISDVFKCLQDCYPWRIKHMIGINCSKAIRAAYYVIKVMLPKKISDRIILLGSDYTELHQYLNPSILPEEYGGCVDQSECSLTQYVLDNLEYLKYERSFGVSRA